MNPLVDGRMIEKILRIKQETKFDFRTFAFPEDPLSYLFSDWVDYYRMKYAICRAIEPKSILEIGVRYGYSTIAFLCASKEAYYLGIDNNSSTYGGVVGAIDWAKKITEEFNAEFLIADTQTMTSFPGECYDFIHIDGQQDGDGTFHDLKLALEKGSYILLDGYFWSKENMLSSTYFVAKYRHFIEHIILLPGYAGDLLIKAKPEARDMGHKFRKKDYRSLEESYDSIYYLRDCEGYDGFRKSKGTELEDGRLLAVYYLANPQEGENILDIGCGRGELSFALSQANARVVGVDYSKDAIEIARNIPSGTHKKDNLDRNPNFIHCDFLNHRFDKTFDKVIAADLIEHIEKESLGKMFQKISDLLGREGLFIVHTPNQMSYTYSYNQKRIRAKEMGLYLPRNPRTYYEDLMHINEQTPARLKRSLKRHFTCVHLWLTVLPNIPGTLKTGLSRKDLLQSTSMFAVASHKELEKSEMLSWITQDKLDPPQLGIVMYSAEVNLTLKKSQRFQLKTSIENVGKQRLVSLSPYPVNIAYHWKKKGGEFETYDGVRTPIRIPLLPSQKSEYKMDILGPAHTGSYVLEITMVQEHNFWFEQYLKNLPININVEVR